MSTAGKPKSVREMVALVVLADHLPMPIRIAFQGKGVGEPGSSILALSVASVAQGQAWSRHLGGRTDTYVNAKTGQTWLDEGVIVWHGWHVQLQAWDESTPVTPLNSTVSAKLTAIAGGAD
jgi:hypothetical protein